MNLAAPPPETDKPDKASLLLSAAVHLLLIGALFFGVQWKSKSPTSVEVEVWRSVAAPVPAAKPEPLPEPPKPEPKPEPKPAPKVEPPPVKPDIAVKEKEKPKKEEPKKPEPKKEEPKKPEPERRSNFDDELKRDLKQAQQQKVAQDQIARATAEANQLAQLKAEQAAAARARGQADYFAKISNKIRDNVVLPSNITGNPEAIFEVAQLPTGEVLSVKLRKSSGNKLLDDAIERAILKSSPLPKPDDPALFRRDLPPLKYRPFEQ